MQKSAKHRELIRAERAVIRELVKSLRVNSEHEYGYLLFGAQLQKVFFKCVRTIELFAISRTPILGVFLAQFFC